MKTLALAIVTLLAASLPARGQFIMNAGESFTFHFDALPFFATGTPSDFPPAGQFVLLFNNATLDGSDSLRMEMFEGSANDPAVSRLTLTTLPWVPLISSPPAWEDHEGTVRVTALSGSFTINEMIMQRNDLTAVGAIDLYQLRLTQVPEPSALAFAGLSATLLAYAVRFRRATEPPMSGGRRPPGAFQSRSPGGRPLSCSAAE